LEALSESKVTGKIERYGRYIWRVVNEKNERSYEIRTSRTNKYVEYEIRNIESHGALGISLPQI